MFSCGLCRNESLLYSRLCVKCDRVYKLGNIYGWDKVYSIIDRCLVIPDENQKIKLDRCIKTIGNSKE